MKNIVCIIQDFMSDSVTAMNDKTLFWSSYFLSFCLNADCSFCMRTNYLNMAMFYLFIEFYQLIIIVIRALDNRMQK